MKPKSWTIEELTELKKLLLNDEGYTFLQIAKIMKRTPGSIEKCVRKILNKFTNVESEKYKTLRYIATKKTQAKKSYWTPEIINKLRVLCESGLYESLSEIRAKIFPNVSVSSLRNVLSDNGLRMYNKKTQRHNEFETESMDSTPITTSAESYWNMMELTSKEEIIQFKRESYHNIKFNKKQYVGFTCIGDQHFGKVGVDYEKAREDAQIIKATDNMYALFGGDFFENYLKANIMEALVNKDSSPKREQMLLEHYFTFYGQNNEEVSEKIIASVSGNHDWRTADVSGIDLVRQMLKGKRILYSPEELRLIIKLNEIEYRIAARHQYRFNSTLNYCHTVKRWYDEGEETFDIGIIWHNHRPDIEEFIKHNEMRWGIRPGSYKIKDRWAKAKGYSITLPLMPTFILNPFEKSISVFKYVKEASDYLKLKNKEIERR
jgi:hypothetical protein